MFQYLIPLCLAVSLVAGDDPVLSEEDKEAQLSNMNGYRVRSGCEKAKNLTWDNSLAGLSFACSLLSMNSLKFYGSVSVVMGDNTISANDALSKAISAWGQEEFYVDPDWKCANPWMYPEYQYQDCSDYSQMIWADTKKVGCTVHRCSFGSLAHCQFKPMGNTFATPCS